jgi:hypothetical protein
VFPVRNELGLSIPEDDILHSHRRDTLKSCTTLDMILETIRFQMLSGICSNVTGYRQLDSSQRKWKVLSSASDSRIWIASSMPYNKCHMRLIPGQMGQIFKLIIQPGPVAR